MNRPGVPPEPRLRRLDDVWSNEVQDRAVLYRWSSGKAIVLNPTGAAVWRELESPRTTEEIVRGLVDRFPAVGSERARADVCTFLDRLLAEGVIEPVP